MIQFKNNIHFDINKKFHMIFFSWKNSLILRIIKSDILWEFLIFISILGLSERLSGSFLSISKVTGSPNCFIIFQYHSIISWSQGFKNRKWRFQELNSQITSQVSEQQYRLYQAQYMKKIFTSIIINSFIASSTLFPLIYLFDISQYNKFYHSFNRDILKVDASLGDHINYIIL